MKYIKYIAAVSALLTLSVSCKNENAEYSILKDQAYFAQNSTKANATTTVSVAADNPAGTTKDLNVRLSDVAQSDRTFKVELFTAEELAAYNTANGTAYVALEADNYKLSTQEVTIKAGASVSDPIQVTILPLSDAEIKSGEQYSLPLKLRSTDGKPVVEGGDEFIYVVKPTIITSVPVLGTDPNDGAWKRASAKLEGETPLPQWTIEFRVNMNGFGMNNQALFAKGGQNEIYIRFGDAATPWNTLQAKFGGTQFDKSNTVFEPNKWYHVALVYNGTTVALYVNGQKDLDTDKAAGKVFTLASNINIAGAHQQWRNGMMIHEYRVWNIARTPAQLKDSEFGVSAKTPGLLHYWKMDEASGREFKNSVSGAPSMFVLNPSDGEATPRWLSNVRSDGAGRTKID